jgi:arylsulfatase A
MKAFHIAFVTVAVLIIGADFKPINQQQSASNDNRPNVIIILADDLGYGDLGWAPFIGNEMTAVRTPNLRSMADNGLIMTNFHTASPLCSPSRASIMVGLFPWRLGVDFIYAGDLKHDGTEEIDHEQLPLIPNIAMSFHDAGYYTAHIGKWHLGGQTHVDIPRRKAGYSSSDGCKTPGILQYGFDEYVGMSEGTGSMRYHTHQAGNTYTAGSNHLFKNDIPLPKPDQPEILTDRQTDEAMRVINEQVILGKPFFLNLWYDAPHSPWEAIPPYYDQFDANSFGTILLRKYASMIMNMDMNVGRILQLLDKLDIASNTIVCFTSDNGPENNAGSAGPFLGLKRLLTEGGIRVPMILQWKGRIKANTKSDKFALTTDLYPTLTHAAGIAMPPHIRIDGTSFLPVLEGKAVAHRGDERIVLWYTHSPGYSKFTAAWSHGYKLLWNDYEGRIGAKLPPVYRLFNMRSDPTERNNLLPSLLNNCDQVDQWTRVRMDSFARSPSSAMIMLLGIQLQLQAHLFRYLGDLDWRIMHRNPTYLYYPSCHQRRSIAESLTWHTPYLRPQFCGYNIIYENAKSSCIGDPQEISATWNHLSAAISSWMSGSLSYGIAHLASLGSGLERSILHLVNITKYQPFCSSLEHQLQSSSSSKGMMISQPKPKHGPGWAHGDGFNHRQRIRTRFKQIYVSGSGSCLDDSPLLILNLPYMLLPLTLCPTSYASYLNQRRMDDATFLVAYNLILRMTKSKLMPPSIASAEMSKNMSRLAMIDPWLYHDWQIPRKSQMLAYYRAFYPRMMHVNHSSSSASHDASDMASKSNLIDLVVIPMLSESSSSFWGATFIFLPSASRSRHVMMIVEPSADFSQSKLQDWKQHVQQSLRLPADPSGEDLILIAYQRFHERIQSEDHGIALILLLRYLYHYHLGSTAREIHAAMMESSATWKSIYSSEQVHSAQRDFISLLNQLIEDERNKDDRYYHAMSRAKFNLKA